MTIHEKLLTAAAVAVTAVHLVDFVYGSVKHSSLAADLFAIPEAAAEVHPLDLPKTDENMPAVLNFYMEERQKEFDALKVMPDPCDHVEGYDDFGVCAGDKGWLMKWLSWIF